MANYVLKSPHTSSYWQEVARTMEAVNAQAKPTPPVTPSGNQPKA